MVTGVTGLVITIFAPLAAAFDGASIEGRVTSSTVHQGIAGVTVTLGAQQTTTDAGGGFRFSELSPGEYSLSFECAGFFKTAATTRLASAVAPARIEIEMVPYSSITGRVVDDAGNAAPGIYIEITEAVRGTGTTRTIWADETDSEGRYRKDEMHPGTYVIMARPDASSPRPPPPKERDGRPRVWVGTYFPSTADRNQAGTVALTGGTQFTGGDIRLVVSPVYAVRGMVYNDTGRPADAAVRLRSCGAITCGPNLQAQARGGSFEFTGVPAGEWCLAAEEERSGGKLIGQGQALVDRHDVENVTVRLAAPFAYQAFVEPRGKIASAHVELYPADASGGVYSNSAVDPFGVVQFREMYAGNYRVNIFASQAGYYLDSILLGDRDVLGKDVAIAEGTPPLHVVFKPNAAGVRGTVENCGRAVILLLPQDEGLWDFRFIRRGACDSSGRFEIGGLRPGGYYALAVDRVDATGLDRVATLRRLAGMAAKVEIESGRVAYVELKVVLWPE